MHNPACILFLFWRISKELVLLHHFEVSKFQLFVPHARVLFVSSGAEFMETPLIDYRYRAWIDCQPVSNAFTKQVEGLTYTDFKNSIKDK